MAIEYDLDFATRYSADEVATRLADIGRQTGILDPSVTGVRLVAEGAETRLGTWIRVIEPKPPQPWNAIVNDLGIVPTVDVGFRLGKENESSDQQDDMIRIVAPLLDRVDGDVVLHFQFEEVWLLRRGGELTLHKDDDLWRPARLAIVSQPYGRETHIMDLD